MKTIEKDELYEHLNRFLKTKGIELTEGSYSQTIQKSCSILADAINLGQKGIERAKGGIDQKLDKMRQVIHEKTAPKSGPKPAEPPPGASSEADASPSSPRGGKRPSKKSRTRRAKRD